jgi:dolichol-phosphate hexosyltransferase
LNSLKLVKDVAAENSPGLTIIVPVYNEEKTLCKALCQLIEASSSYPSEIIVVNDGSMDSSASIIREFKHLLNIRFVDLTENRGKGNAVRVGISLASMSHVIIFDVDLEYSPYDIARLFSAVQMGLANVVYGVRMPGLNSMQPSLTFAWGRRILTQVTNIIYGSAINDLHTCLKLIPIDFLRKLELTESGFGLDTEITALLLRNGLRPFEMPITYIGRGALEGKKIRKRDGLDCLRILIKKRFSKRIDYKYSSTIPDFSRFRVDYLQNSNVAEVS